MEIITNPVNSLHTQQLLKGVNILLKYDPNATFDALDEQIFFGRWIQDEGDIKVSEEDKVRLEELDWFFDTEFEGWSYYV